VKLTDMGTPPDGLDKTGALEWHRAIKLMREIGANDEIDRQSLYVYCEAYQEFDALVKRCAKEDHITISEKGLPYQNPIVGMKNKAADRLLKASKEFAMTPLTRNRMGVMEKEAEDEFTAFIRKGKA
jgi:P27 family predicted phage terminase small subunit